MRTFSSEMTLIAGQADVPITMSAAVTNVITSVAHGLAVGDAVTFTTDTTLPAGLSADTLYYVVSVIDADTYKVSATPGGTEIDVTDTGTGVHTMHKEFQYSMLVHDWHSLVLSLHTSGSTQVELYARISIADVMPTFNWPASESNRIGSVMLINLEDFTGTEGDDGVLITGTDIAKLFKINVDGAHSFGLFTKKFYAGQITAKIKGFLE